jgi:hypothetical protein
MEALEELRKWVESLTGSEKRQVTLLGKMRSGSAQSQHLQLFHWFCTTTPGTFLPSDSPLHRNLPTTIARLKDLLLDSLRLLHAGKDLDASLRTTLDQIAQLFHKKLYHQALRLIARPKALAISRCRYPEALQLVHWEGKVLRAIHPLLTPEQIYALCREEEELLERLHTLLNLRQRHERLLSLVRHNALPRGTHLDAEVENLADSSLVSDWQQLNGYLERALACNILAIRHLMQRSPYQAVQLYEILLAEWRLHPEWVAEEASLLLTICNYFQTACFYSKMDWNQARHFFAMVPDFGPMEPDTRRHFQRLLYHGQLTPALNTGNFDSVTALIPVIEAWLQDNAPHLSEAQVMPFLHNFAVAYFLMCQHQPAFRCTQRILNMPNRKVRRDIREFALVLQSVLQYELGDHQLIEYLTRAGKRHFETHTREMEFERSVLHCLERVMGTSEGDHSRQWERLDNELATLATQLPGTVPILGLTEMQLWVKGKLEGRSLTDVFKDALEENLRSMEQ